MMRPGVVRNKSLGFDGIIFYSDKTYNVKGQVTKETSIYPSDGSENHSVSYSYYDDGRIKNQTLPGNVVITNTYDGNNIEVNYSTGESYSKEYDATGLLTESTDPGGTISYSHKSFGAVKNVEGPGGISTIFYDSFGRQVTLDDPDAGSSNYTYDIFNQLESQTDANSSTKSMTYDKLGRIKTVTCNGIVDTYTYDGINGKGMLMGISRSDGNSISYEYDGFQRVISETKSDGVNTFTFEYEYDQKGNLIEKTYPNGFELQYTYDEYDLLIEIRNGSTLIWRLDDVNDNGQIEAATYGTNQITYSYDAQKRLNGIYVPEIIDFDYIYNQKSQLEFRIEKYYVIDEEANEGSFEGIIEKFYYDGVNRLVEVEVGGSTVLSIAYDPTTNDRIKSKSDYGNYIYESEENHKLDYVVPYSDELPPEHEIEYNTDGKVTLITEYNNSVPEKTLDIFYGVDDQRFKTTYSFQGSAQYSRYFFADYEKEVLSDNSERHLNYIYAGGSLVAIVEQVNSNEDLHYIYEDHLGSIRCITDDNGTIEEALSFDPWGNRREPNTGDKYTSTPSNLMFARGFTGHEHLDEFNLINMNGRIYDPDLAMFLSPDNYVQSPENSQNYNRYSYCLNKCIS